MKTSIHIQNLKCRGCVQTITKNIGALKGIENFQIDLDGSEIHFEHQEASVVEEVKSQLKKLGYPEDTEKNTFGLKAKSYVSCALGKMS